MTTRGRRALVVFAGLAGVLFAGRSVAGFLAESWWAAGASPAGTLFAVRWSLLRAMLDVGAVLLSIAWFAAGLLTAARLGSRAAALNPPDSGVVAPVFLRWWSSGIAILLGVLCGAGSSAWAPQVALAIENPSFGLLDAHLGWDIGFFLGTLPALLILQQFLLALALLGFVATTMLYIVAGALRVAAREFTLAPAIRLHLGLLGALLALLLGAGYFLEPLQLAGGLRPSMSAAHLSLLSTLARGMVGFSLAVAVLTLVWGIRGRMMLPIGGWASFALCAIAIRLLAPAAGTSGDSLQTSQVVRELEREAFHLPELIERRGGAASDGDLGSLELRLWDEALALPPSGAWIGADRVAAVGGGAGVGLLLVGVDPEGHGIQGYQMADALVTSAGGPLSYRANATEPLPGLIPIAEWPDARSWPGLDTVRVFSHDGGVAAGGTLRRLVLTWALQENMLAVDPSAHLDWRLDPGERLHVIAPFAEWSAPRPRIVEGRLLWVADGYLHGASFPGVAPTPWRGRSVSYLRAAFVGVVGAADGKVRIFERGRADPVAAAWTAIAGGLVESAGALPPGLADQLHYPGELFAVQARVLQRPHWGIGTLGGAGRLDSLAGPVREMAYLPTDGQQVVALLEAEHRSGADQLRLIRYHPDTTLDRPGLLAERWQRLPYVVQMTDSVRASGARLILGQVHLVATAAGLVGYQTGHAVDSAGRATLAVVNLALGARFGTGPRADASWRNLRGEVAALPVSVGAAGQLREAREWLLKADSAFRRGDLAAFGRAFEALRAILDYPPGPAK
ncbi:MAG: UPF0182 family protein [Gemmatimonadota bacterium]|nr:UPF0182 family protein [Gemmatimonadota bacterium]